MTRVVACVTVLSMAVEHRLEAEHDMESRTMLTEILKLLEGLLGDRGQAQQALAAVVADGDGGDDTVAPMAFMTDGAGEHGDGAPSATGLAEPLTEMSDAEDQAPGGTEGGEDGAGFDGDDMQGAGDGDTDDGARGLEDGDAGLGDDGDADGGTFDFIAPLVDLGGEGDEGGVTAADTGEGAPEVAGQGEESADAGEGPGGGGEFSDGDGAGDDGESDIGEASFEDGGNDSDGEIAGLPLIPVEDRPVACACEDDDDQGSELLDLA